MKKLSVYMSAVALMIALSGSAMAETSTINTATLKAMGLAGIELLSDSDALEIRGFGYTPRPPRHSKPWSMAYGNSHATTGGRKGGPSAGSRNGFKAVGKYMAMGDNYSEASTTTIKVDTKFVKGKPATKKVWRMTHTVGAGGSASASSL